MMQKVKDALHQRDDMRIQMEEAFTAKEAVSTVTHLLNVTFVVQCNVLFLAPWLFQFLFKQLCRRFRCKTTFIYFFMLSS